MPLSWFDGLARILSCVEDFGIWPDGLLDAYITMIPKVDGDATPLVQRPLSVLPVVYCSWASARMGQLEHWFRSWVPESVFSAGGGRSSVEAWYTSALDIEEVLAGATGSDVHLFVADVIKSFDIGLFVVICGAGLFLMKVIGGLSSWMFGILGVILIPLFMVGPLPWLLGLALSFLDWFLSLLFLWIFMVGCGFFVLCLFLVLCMVLRLLFLLALACGS